MSEILRANKRSNYFNRKRNNKYKNRSDSDDSIARGGSNYQRLLSNSSSKSESRNFTSQSNPIILKYANGEETNLLPWLERTGTILLARYGNSAKFFTGEAYKRERPSATLYDAANDPTGIKRKLQETFWIEYVKESTRLKEDRPKVWGDMELYMSKESLDAVKAKPTYEQLKSTFKVVSFLKLIKQVHRTEPAVRSSTDAVADALQEFHSIKQNTDELLIDYKNRIIAAVERIETADPDEKPDPLTVARKFTRSLDLNRFEELVRQCRDDETKYATTLSEAHNQASSQLVAIKGKLVPCETLKRGNNIAGAASIQGLTKKEYKMVMSMRKEDHTKDHSITDGKGKKRKRDEDEIVAAAATNNKKYKKNQDNKPSSNPSEEGGGGTCDLCNRSNHTTENCYYLNRCREMVSQQRNQRQQQFNSNPGGYQPQYQSNYGNGPAPQFQPGRQVTYGNTGGVNNSNDLNYGYPGRANPTMRPFNQS